LSSTQPLALSGFHVTQRSRSPDEPANLQARLMFSPFARETRLGFVPSQRIHGMTAAGSRGVPGSVSALATRTRQPLPQIADTTAAILLARFTTRPIPEICPMGGITLEDFTQSVAYKEIFGLGEQQGLRQGLQAGELEITLRLLQRRCGALPPDQEARVRALPLPRLETLAEALLDFQGPDDLTRWLARG
jgi:hypothetical protein